MSSSAGAEVPHDTLYRLLVQEVTEYAIYMLTADGIVASWNAGAERFKGYRAAEILGRSFAEFHTPEDRAAGLPQQALATARAEGKFEGEGWRLRKDGSRFRAHVVIDAVHDTSGRLLGFAKITRDITAQHEAERRSTESERAFRLLVQGVTDYAIYMLDPRGMVSNWNDGAERLKGYAAAEIVGRHFSVFHTAEDLDAGSPQQALATALAVGKFEDEGWRLRKDGSRFWAHVVLDPIEDVDGTLLGFTKITRDLTEQREQSTRLQRITDKLDLALANMSQGLCLFDADERLALCNRRFREMLRLDEAAAHIGSTFTQLLSRLHGPGARGAIRRIREEHLASLAGTHHTVAEEMIREGRTIAMSHRALPGGGWVTTMDDITERRQIERRIVHLAHHDGLTELPNRASFRARLDAETSTEGSCAVLYLDLDRFKPVNDTLGHPAGDALLRAVAERVQGLLRPQDVVARLGGDEFAVMLGGCARATEAGTVADRLIREIGRPFVVSGLQVLIGASIGLAVAPLDGTDPDILLRNADLALYQAKQAGRGCHRAYVAGMERVMQERLELEQDLRRALCNNEFLLHYQPVVDLERDHINGFEALLRWDSPVRGRVSPGEFIPLAEEIGLMPEIGDWIMRTACREAAAWPDGLKVSVNLSPTQFRAPHLVGDIQAALAESGLPPHRLELEITETAMIDDMEMAKTTLHRLRDLGIDIAMDDFGTGYSSLSFLRSLPFTRIKIDRSFVQDLGVKPEAAAIVRAVTGLCGSLGVATTAEGVETESQIAMLRAEGCPEVQGFLISRPCPAGEVHNWIADFRSSRSGRVPAALSA
ncbi:EAL domain-containing protein [Pseudoroseomonas globiformis]|uniref:EAL domain-containing protein n=1 Tax=Teichococcus globiformis TaxID=2307229 RepID=A0ABV7G096_9PROT